MTALTGTSRSRHQRELFSDSGGEDTRRARTRGSMLWAAYGDALGFVSELVSEKVLERRTGGQELSRLVPWERRVGGRRGVTVHLPPGSWSDDTQLRMAVSRAIDHHGFDVDAFARIELPVWPSYALGGGRASKAAARNLVKPRTAWFTNTFARWSDAGGNGAAMRIQPHVWSSPELGSEYLEDVIIDSVCTHGHLRAIVGACFHAASLAHCLKHGRVPDPDRLAGIATETEEAVRLIEDHQSLGLWMGLWEGETNRSLREEWTATVAELRSALDQAADGAARPDHTAAKYRGISDRLGLEAKHQRGSGILTTVAAVALAGIATEPHEAVVTAANALGTDTDTIATMAGALLGACDGAGEPPEEVLDRTYLIYEADRLTAISEGHEVDRHPHPDILRWTAPRVQADALVSDDGHLVVKGLGRVAETNGAPQWEPGKGFGWQWVRTEFGQTLLIKRRREVRSTSNGVRIGNEAEGHRAEVDRAGSPPAEPPDTPDTHSPAAPRVEADEHPRTEPRPVDVDRAVRYAKSYINENSEIGYTLREVARRGSRDQYLAVVVSLYDDLRKSSPRKAGRGRPGNDPNAPRTGSVDLSGRAKRPSRRSRDGPKTV